MDVALCLLTATSCHRGLKEGGGRKNLKFCFDSFLPTPREVIALFFLLFLQDLRLTCFLKLHISVK